MALPAGGPAVAWPPPQFQSTYNRYAEFAAWYSGSPEQLSSVYGGLSYIDQVLGQPPLSSKSGFAWPFRRWFFWSRRNTIIPPTRVRLHVPLAADIATTSADLLFAKDPTFDIPEAHLKRAPGGAKDAQARLEDLVADDDIVQSLLEGAESASALGGAFLRVIWDRAFVADRPMLDVVQADAALPEFRWDELAAVTFWRIVQDDGKAVWRHLERHEPGWILHGLYRGDKNNLGWPVPLSDIPELAPLATEVSVEGSAIETKIPMLTAAYVPNLRPNRLDRGSKLGRSDYAGSEGLLDSLDETWTSWIRDLRLGRARLIVPAAWIRSMGPGKGAQFDLDEELFTPLEGMPPTDAAITENQFAIRVAEHRDTAESLIERIVSTAGYSSYSFGLGDAAGGPVTATEIATRERRSLITRDKKAGYWRRPLASILEALLAIDSVFFEGGVPFRPTITFPESVPMDLPKMSESLQLLAQAEAISTRMKVVMLHPDWGPEKVDEEVTAIGTLPRPAGAPSLPGTPPAPGVPPVDPAAQPPAAPPPAPPA